MDWSTFWSSFWIVIEVFVFVAYLMVMFNILGDIFRDRAMGGVGKALWIIALIMLPIVSALVYLITRGKGMDHRRNKSTEAAQQAMDEYIQRTARAADPAKAIADAHTLLTQGVITQGEFDAIKAKVLA